MPVAVGRRRKLINQSYHVCERMATLGFKYLQNVGATTLDPLSPQGLSAIHVEAYVTALRGYCRVAGISQGELARRIGISQEHLSYVLHQRRHPGRAFEQRIWQAQDLPPDLKESILRSIWGAQHFAEQERSALAYEIRHKPIGELAAEVEQQYFLVGSGRAGGEDTRRLYHALYAKCDALTSRLPYARADAYAYIRLCVIQAEAGCVLDRLYDALRVALLAERIAGTLEGFDHHARIRELYAPWMSAVRTKGMVLYNLHLYGSAYYEFSRAEESRIARDKPDLWLPHIARDKLKALAATGRFSIREAEECARRARDACGSAIWDARGAEVLSFLVDLSLVRCYTSCGRESTLRKARQTLAAHSRRLSSSTSGGLAPLHQVMFHRACAEVEEALGSDSDAEDSPFVEALRSALRIAHQAGLENQIRKAMQRHGATLQRLAEREGIRLAWTCSPPTTTAQT